MAAPNLGDPVGHRPVYLGSYRASLSDACWPEIRRSSAPNDNTPHRSLHHSQDPQGDVPATGVSRAQTTSARNPEPTASSAGMTQFIPGPRGPPSRQSTGNTGLNGFPILQLFGHHVRKTQFLRLTKPKTKHSGEKPSTRCAAALHLLDVCSENGTASRCFSSPMLPEPQNRLPQEIRGGAGFVPRTIRHRGEGCSDVNQLQLLPLGATPRVDSGLPHLGH